MDDLKRSREVHHTAIMGSSLIVTANSGVEANHLGHEVNLTSYHKATYLDSLLADKFGGTFNTFNLAAPGLMASDAYLSLKTLLESGQHPDVLIYGVAPRDFVDSSVKCPADTDVFKYLRRLTKIDEIADATFRSPQEKFDWLLQKNIYLYAAALDYQLAAADACQQLIGFVLPRQATQPPVSLNEMEILLPKFKLAATHPERSNIKPTERQIVTKEFFDNRGEYLERYQWPNNYELEVTFLERIITLCKEQQIQLVLVNMPILPANTALLPKGFYPSYQRQLKDIANREGIAFLDYNSPLTFDQSDFHDPVHLNAFGGQKFFQTLVDSLAESTVVGKTLAAAGSKQGNAIAGTSLLTH